MPGKSTLRRTELRHRIHAAAGTIRQQPGLDRDCGATWIRRAHMCIENELYNSCYDTITHFIFNYFDFNIIFI